MSVVDYRKELSPGPSRSCAGAILILLALLAPPGAWAQSVRLGASPVPAASHAFGHSIDVDGNVLVAGAPEEAMHAGAVYVFAYNPASGWEQERQIVSPDSAQGSAFGAAIDLEGSFLLVGAPGAAESGAAYVFYRDPVSGWEQRARLAAPDPGFGDGFGTSVALGGTVALVGAPYEDAGTVHAFDFHAPGEWRHRQTLIPAPQETGSAFGAAIALDREYALVGAPMGNEPRGREAGLAFLYARTAGSDWILRAVLQASDARQNNNFGAAIAIGRQELADAPYAVVGAPQAGPRREGAAYLFTETDMRWTEVDRYSSPESSSRDRTGAAVAMRGSLVVIGVPGRDTGAAEDDAGIAYLLSLEDPHTWRESAQLTAQGPTAQSRFASAVAIGGEQIVIGAPGEDAAYVYDRSIVETNAMSPAATSTSLSLTNYPNPFHTATTVVVGLPTERSDSRQVYLAVYDALGRRIAVLLDGMLSGQQHTVQWSAPGLATGAYLYRLSVGNNSRTGRMTLIR